MTFLLQRRFILAGLGDWDGYESCRGIENTSDGPGDRYEIGQDLHLYLLVGWAGQHDSFDLKPMRQRKFAVSLCLSAWTTTGSVESIAEIAT